jgi:hypothetical protein
LKADLIRKLTISSPIIEETFGSNRFADFKAFTLAEFDKFSDTIPILKDRNNRSNFSYGPLLLATFRALTHRYNCTEVQAMDIVTKIIEHLGHHELEHMHPVLKFAYAKIGKYSFLQNIMQSYFHYRHEPFGWQAVVRDDQDAYVAADMTACGLFQWLSLNHAPQLCAVACASDYITMEAIPHLKLVRKQTIANGDPICSFRYIQKVQ